MQWEVHPVNIDIEIPLQLFNTPGTEIAPWSHVIAEYFQRDRLSHPSLLESRHVVARQFYQCFRITMRGAAFASIRSDSNAVIRSSFMKQRRVGCGMLPRRGCVAKRFLPPAVPHSVGCTAERLRVADHLEMLEAVNRLERPRPYPRYSSSSPRRHHHPHRLRRGTLRSPLRRSTS
jgi:hypothetical protein